MRKPKPKSCSAGSAPMISDSDDAAEQDAGRGSPRPRVSVAEDGVAQPQAAQALRARRRRRPMLRCRSTAMPTSVIGSAARRPMRRPVPIDGSGSAHSRRALPPAHKRALGSAGSRGERRRWTPFRDDGQFESAKSGLPSASLMSLGPHLLDVARRPRRASGRSRAPRPSCRPWLGPGEELQRFGGGRRRPPAACGSG